MLLESGHGDALVGITRGNILAFVRAIVSALIKTLGITILLEQPALVNAVSSALRGKVFRFVPFDPLYIAAQTRLLWIRDWLFCKGGIECSSQVGTCDRDAALGATVIELTTIGQLLVLIENKKVRCASSPIGLRN